MIEFLVWASPVTRYLWVPLLVAILVLLEEVRG